jgi:hypothetical protein
MVVTTMRLGLCCREMISRDGDEVVAEALGEVLA